MEELTINLFEPGMSVFHRAGLGGLACTLDWIEKVPDPTRRLPGGGAFDDRKVTIRWEGGAEGAGNFFRQLYEIAFDIRGGLIHLPGCYGPEDISPQVKAELQQGMSQTILQFGPNRKAASKTPRIRTYDVDGRPMAIQHQDLAGYTHQKAWEDLITSKGTLKPRTSISGTIAPGFVQRHVAHPSSVIEQPPGLAIALHFALIGTLSLAIDQKRGVMIVPDVQDLTDFVERRQFLNPRNVRGCQVNGPADAALQAEVRLRASETGAKLRIDHCQAVLFMAQSWNDKQKTRASVLEVDVRERDLDLFEEVMKIKELAPRIAQAKPDRKGRASPSFWSKGVVRPLIAENLARRQPWYQGFRRLVVSADGRSDEDRARLLGYETRGIHAMIQKAVWQDRGEGVLVASIHNAMRGRYAAIGEDTDDPVTFSNRVKRQRQRWRLAFSGAKTSDDLRAALADLWSRSHNPTLQSEWRSILPWVCDEDRWRLTRDLALLALASYKSPDDSGDAKGPDPGLDRSPADEAQ